jgi:antitoxin HigA-1
MQDIHFGVDTPEPPTPGSLLRKHLHRMNTTQSQLAKALGVSRVWVNGILTGRCSVSPGMALRLGRVLATRPDAWLYLQAELDLRRARERLQDELEHLRVLEPRERVHRSRALRLRATNAADSALHSVAIMSDADEGRDSATLAQSAVQSPALHPSSSCREYALS